METKTLANNIKIPVIGYGTWQSANDDTTVTAIKEALNAGYTHIDTAACYDNEESVGKAIKESGIPRENLFITSKVWNTDRGYENTLKAFNTTLQKLGLDYLDLYLIHWPANEKQFSNWETINLDTWKALEELYREGKVKSIGVSNFLERHLKIIMDKGTIKPMVNQLEVHPGFEQKEITKYCRDNNIVVEAWSPIGSGALLKNPTLENIATKYHKSVAQLCIRWCLEKGTVPLPKSMNSERIKQNIDVFDFDIDDNDMAIIDSVPNPEGLGKNPDEVDF